MRKYLMTWYGITDFRASLGLEHTTGPVLGALLAEDYTDAVILGYTNPNKTKSEKNAFQQKLVGIGNSDPARVGQFLDLFSNTEEAHKHFIRWLQKQLVGVGNKVVIRFSPLGLKHLNDTEGIYEAATQSLNAVSSEQGEKLVTLYLSPGTPAMAFVWAFAALRYPNLKKRLIASSQTGRPPEKIVLPNEWLEWHGRQVRSIGSDTEGYDIIFHLFGEQRMPSLLGVLQFPSRKHIFVNSEQFPADVMKQFIGDSEYAEVAVDPFDPENVRTTILNLIAEMPSNVRIGFNLTGGTKLMYAGALAACRKVNATPFYFSSRNNKAIFLNDFRSIDTKLIPSVETFIKLNVDNLFISKQGYWEEIPGIISQERKKLTFELWKNRLKISKFYKDLSRYSSKYNNKPEPFSFSKGEISIHFSALNEAKITIGSKVFQFKKWPSFAFYLCGGWLEEYTYLLLQPLVKAGLIKDLRIGLEVSFKDDSPINLSSGFQEQLRSLFGETYQELDITFTDGRRLYVIECKAGFVNSAHIMKLQNIIRYFGGIEGRAILVSSFLPNNIVVKKKIEDSNNIHLVSGGNLLNKIKTILKV